MPAVAATRIASATQCPRSTRTYAAQAASAFDAPRSATFTATPSGPENACSRRGINATRGISGVTPAVGAVVALIAPSSGGGGGARLVISARLADLVGDRARCGLERRRGLRRAGALRRAHPCLAEIGPDLV